VGGVDGDKLGYSLGVVLGKIDGGDVDGEVDVVRLEDVAEGAVGLSLGDTLGATEEAVGC